MRKSTKFCLVGAAVLCTASLYFAFTEFGAVTFQSQESKTVEGAPVFNRIVLQSTATSDIWMMQQSHHGITAEAEKWDRLAIVVDKTQTPKRARFYQLESGPLHWDGANRQKEFRVSCFVCHPNGPRAIRPERVGGGATLRLLERARVGLWNLRIKSYGRVVHDPAHDVEDQTATTPFRFRSSLENDRLQVASCTRCHSESGFLARGFLTRQNALTIGFMLKKQHMPPLFFGLPADDEKAIAKFLEGF